ncbi:hypothetical protein D4764_16G0005440 [Takifugu flavidus]|uniref:Uncharacterized protein n=1 Tax=Takifugu flavidus TaxID=433684 RepID=A0A5C6P1S8_9TELE|nr:hypothetical protein D4764_16G0005440 [Takifugu flavidus]
MGEEGSLAAWQTAPYLSIFAFCSVYQAPLPGSGDMVMDLDTPAQDQPVLKPGQSDLQEEVWLHLSAVPAAVGTNISTFLRQEVPSF